MYSVQKPKRSVLITRQLRKSIPRGVTRKDTSVAPCSTFPQYAARHNKITLNSIWKFEIKILCYVAMLPDPLFIRSFVKIKFHPCGVRSELNGHPDRPRPFYPSIFSEPRALGPRRIPHTCSVFPYTRDPVKIFFRLFVSTIVQRRLSVILKPSEKRIDDQLLIIWIDDFP